MHNFYNMIDCPLKYDPKVQYFEYLIHQKIR